MKLYRPANATAGDDFMTKWCFNCRKYRAGQCAILMKTMDYAIDELGYPKEWRYNVEHRPICTAFEDKSVYVRPIRHTHPNPTQLALFEGGGRGV
jgi:hypothetical protein